MGDILMIKTIQANKNLLWITQNYIDTFISITETGPYTTSFGIVVSSILPSEGVTFGVINNSGALGVQYLTLQVRDSRSGKKIKLSPILNSNFLCYNSFSYDNEKYEIASISINMTASSPFYDLTTLFVRNSPGNLGKMERLLDIITETISTDGAWTLRATIYYLIKK